jgi:hypothetical protein
MRMPILHNDAGCLGKLVRVSSRPERTGGMNPIGYVCDTCQLFLPDGAPMTKLSDLRPSIESAVNELTTLLIDRQVHDRFEGVVRENKSLLASAQQGNLFLQGVRRWWATSAALILRRHVDGGTTQSLRTIVETLAGFDEKLGPSASPRTRFSDDLRELTAISESLRPYLNSLIFGSSAELRGPALTFNDLGEAIETVRKIAERAYANITNISLLLKPTILPNWTEIFKYPWIGNDDPMAYTLGEEGVPYDALPMTELDAQQQARLDIQIEARKDGSRRFAVANVGQLPALDVRVFLPYASTVIDENEIEPGKSVVCTISPAVASTVSGQAVLEFADVHDRIYRQYADVGLQAGRVRKLSRVAYRVGGRIVASGAGIA